MKIVNKRKFVRGIVLVFFIILGVITLTKKTYSKGEISYKENYICQGETLWSISKQEIKNNKYFENKDIREVVYELKIINNLGDSYLYDGQKIKIPMYKTSN